MKRSPARIRPIPRDALKYISVWPATTVVARKLFYAGSTRYNVTNGMFPGHSDDNAIAADKVALLPGAGAATFSQFVELLRRHYGRDGGSFGRQRSRLDHGQRFHVQDGQQQLARPMGCRAVAGHRVGAVGAGVSGSDRVELIWPAGQLAQTWLEVTVAANSHTRLAQPDVFYFGNAVGDSGLGDTVLNALVNWRR